MGADRNHPRRLFLWCLEALVLLASFGALASTAFAAGLDDEPAPVAQLVLERPTAPVIVARAVLPLPDGHGLDLGSLECPLTFADASGTLIPTQLDRCLTLAGQVRSVELTAVVPSVVLPLQVVRAPSPPAVFVPDLKVLRLVLGGFRFEALAPDARYAASIGAADLRLHLGPQRTRASFAVPLTPAGEGAELANLGWLRGTLTAYTGLPLVEMDVLWHSGDLNAPTIESFFHSLDLALPADWVCLPAAAQPWMERGPPGEDGVVRVVRSASAIGPDDWHTMRGQSAKLLRFVLIHESVADFADDWRDNSGRGLLGPVAGVDDCWWPGNPDTPLAVDGFALPEFDEAALAKARASISSFRARRIAGEAHQSSPHGRLGWRHPAGSKYGAMTGGEGIEHAPFSVEIATGSRYLWDHLWGDAEAWIDRQTGWLFDGAQPFDVRAWLATNASGRLNYSISPGPPGGLATALWPSMAQDPFGYRAALRNAPDGTGGLGEASAQSFGAVDAQHLIRLYRSWVILAVYGNDPLAKDLIRCFAAAVRADIAAEPHPSASLWGLMAAAESAPGRGSVVNRAEGWAATLQAHDYALNGTAAAREWLEVYSRLLTACQMPAGGWIAWDSNKEATAYAKQESGGKDLAVMQTYQGAILAWAAHDALQVGVESVRTTLERQLACQLHVYRGPGMSEPPYRLAVYPKGHPELPVLSWSDVEGLYRSASTSGYHHTVTLALALRHDIEGARTAVLDWSGEADPLEVLASANRYWGNRAPLAAELQRLARIEPSPTPTED